MRGLVEDLQEQVTTNPNHSGLYLDKEDFEEVRTKTADGQGRISLGASRSGEDIKVVVLESDKA